MCHGHPHYHECQHTSVKWLYCPEAGFDLETGYETPCSNPIYSAPQPSSLSCPLQNCHYKTLRGSWTCCRCGYESNTQGWCDGQVEDAGGYRLEGFPPPSVQTCGHGCCSKCIGNGSSSSISSPEPAYAVRKGKHRTRRTHDYDYRTNVSGTETSSTCSSSADMVPYGGDVAYAKKSKSSNREKKDSRRSRMAVYA